MSCNFELNNDLSKKEIRKLMLKLNHSATETVRPRISGECTELSRLKKTFKNALKQKYVVFESKRKKI
jgi:hypothetical protein